MVINNLLIAIITPIIISMNMASLMQKIGIRKKVF